MSASSSSPMIIAHALCWFCWEAQRAVLYCMSMFSESDGLERADEFRNSVMWRRIVRAQVRSTEVVRSTRKHTNGPAGICTESCDGRMKCIACIIA